MNDRRNFFWALPLIILLAVTLLSSVADMWIARQFYDFSTRRFTNNALTDFFYDWGVMPAIVTAIGAALVYLLTFVQKKWKPWRKPSLFLVLTMVVGAGFITHTVLKDHWGRPRPKQVIAFGGTQNFRSVYEPNFFEQPEPSKSFPCGHCTMGFYFFSFIFLGWRLRKPYVIYLGIALTAVLGTGLSITRMAQGGHFFSDVVAAGIVMWLTAFLCDWMLYHEEEQYHSS